MLIKTSFSTPLMEAPTLSIGGASVRGRMGDTRGEHWYFYVTDLRPRHRYTLSLAGAKGRPLCEPWELATFPDPNERTDRFRLLIYTCGGGHEVHKFLATAVRHRLLRRGLSFQPDAVVANGDQVYWDLLAPVGGPLFQTPEAIKLAGSFDRSAIVLGGDNETVLKRAAGPQIVPVYGADFRSTPVFSCRTTTTILTTTRPPTTSLPSRLRSSCCSSRVPRKACFIRNSCRMVRARLACHGRRPATGGCLKSFGTIRYGRLAEILLYDVRRTLTLAGPSAVYVDPEVEKWLKARTAATEVTHVVHVPSNPPGWTAGKWGEWYPDVLGPDGKLTANISKPYWQSGWLKQHDRLMQAMAANQSRTPLVISGDLHAIGIGRMLRSGTLDLKANPITTVLSGPIGSRPGPNGWPSGRRGTGAMPPAHLDMDEQVKPIEQHGFTLVDFTPDKMVLRLFKWDWKTQTVEAIDNLEPFHTAELIRPV
ncbi:MAG TPA: hypothetical protein VGO01_23310 [Bradyrhizobium sp.]|nr:hypothetical protein [Bradyrhizobium sp.]